MNQHTCVKRRVLIVDDVDDFCQALREIFELSGYEASVAHSGAEALSAAARNRFNLFLLDFLMPGMNGLELFSRLKEMNPATSALMITGMAAEKDIQEALHMGVKEVFYKPINIEEMLATAERILNVSE